MMTEIQELQHRLAMVQDDIKALVDFIDENRLMESLDIPTKHGDSAWTYISNIEIACDIKSDESLIWKLYTI